MERKGEVQATLVVKYMLSMSRNSKIKVMHMAMIFAILQIAIMEGAGKSVNITRRKAMDTAHIQSIATYHKYLKELEQMGYINYTPSYHPREGSIVFLSL